MRRQTSVPILAHGTAEIPPPVPGDVPAVVDDFVQVGGVHAQFNCQPFRADGRALCQELAEMVGEGEGGVHWRNIRSFDWKGWSKLRVSRC